MHFDWKEHSHLLQNKGLQVETLVYIKTRLCTAVQWSNFLEIYGTQCPGIDIVGTLAAPPNINIASALEQVFPGCNHDVPR